LRRIADGVEQRVKGHGLVWVLQKRSLVAAGGERKRRLEFALGNEVGEFEQALAAFAESCERFERLFS